MPLLYTLLLEGRLRPLLCRSWSLAFLKSAYSNCFLGCYPPRSRLMPKKIKLFTLSTSSDPQQPSVIINISCALRRCTSHLSPDLLRYICHTDLNFFHHSIFPSRHQIIYFLIFSEISSLFFIHTSNLPYVSFSSSKKVLSILIIYFHLLPTMVPPV